MMTILLTSKLNNNGNNNIMEKIELSNKTKFCIDVKLNIIIIKSENFVNSKKLKTKFFNFKVRFTIINLKQVLIKTQILYYFY